MDKHFLFLVSTYIVFVNSLPTVRVDKYIKLKNLIQNSKCDFPPMFLATDNEYSSQFEACSDDQQHPVLRQMCSELEKESNCPFKTSSATLDSSKLPISIVTGNLHSVSEKDNYVTKLCQNLTHLSWTQSDDCVKACSSAFFICDLYDVMDRVLRDFFEHEVQDYTHLDEFVHSGELTFLYPFPPVGALHNHDMLLACSIPPQDRNVQLLCKIIAEVAVRFVKNRVNVTFHQRNVTVNVTSSWDPCTGMSAFTTFSSSPEFTKLQQNCQSLCTSHSEICKMIYIGIERFLAGGMDKSVVQQQGTGNTLEKQPGANNTVEHEPGTGNTLEKQPGTGNTLENQPGTGNTGEKQPETGNSVLLQPGAGNTLEKQPGTDNTGDKQPGTGNSVLLQPGTGNTGEKQPGTGNSMLLQPGTGNTLEKQPGAHNTVEHEPGTGNTLEKQPGTGNTLENQPGTGNTGEKQPETVNSVLLQPGDGNTLEKQPGTDNTGEKQPVPTKSTTEKYEEYEDYTTDYFFDGNQFRDPEPAEYQLDKQTDTKKPEQTKNNVAQSMGRAVDEDDSSGGHFMAYFLVFIVLSIAGYIIFHNKQKIIALVVEGKSGKGGRRPNTKEYKQLKTDDVMPSLEKSAYSKDYVF